MRVSPVVKHRQTMLFDTPLTTLGQTRLEIGRWAEEWAAKTLKGRQHVDSSRWDYCPDVSCNDEYFEVKAVGNNRELFVYHGRLEKDISVGLSIHYFVIHHRYSFEPCMVSELRSRLSASIVCVYLIPLPVVYFTLKQSRRLVLNTAYGGSDRREQYASGYRVNLKMFNRWKQ